MKLLDCAKDILLEFVPKSAIQHDSEYYTTIEFNWFITQHALGRMTRGANLEILTQEEIEDMCDRAVKEIVNIAYDKRNGYVFRPGFEFQIRDKDNYFATLACVVEKHINLQQMVIIIKTTVKSGSTLKYKGEFSGQQLVIDI